jgi:hypothetical protein
MAASEAAAAANSPQLQAVVEQYEKDLAAQNASGPFDLGPEQRELNRKAFKQLVGLAPFNAWDIHCVNTCDLIYRFLIQQRWDVDKAVAGIKGYKEWREKNKMNEVLWEEFDPELEKRFSFQGVDFNGQPICLNCPDPTFVGTMLERFPREVLLRHQLKVVEQGRRICLSLNAQRISGITDLQHLGLSIVKNMSAMGLLKEAATLIQHMYPENMRIAMICNGGWVWSGLWAIIRPFLDERVQKKFHTCGAGDDMKKELAKFMDLAQIPVAFGGKAPDNRPLQFKALAEIRSLPRATAPTWAVGAYQAAPFAEFSAVAAAAAAMPGSPGSPPTPASPPSTPAGAYNKQ